MKRLIPVAVALVLIVVSAIVQGRWSERWDVFPELKIFADQLDNVPIQIGDWQGDDREKPTQRILDIAGAVGSLSRDYRNEKGETVSVFLVCGRLQDMFHHEPKRCYRAAGFEMRDEPKKQEFTLANGETAEFFDAQFEKSDETGSKQNQVVYWSWCGTGKWIAPTEHKWTFAGQRALYKLYVIYTPGPNQTPEHNPAADFIPVLLPELQKAFEKATSATPSMKSES